MSRATTTRCDPGLWYVDTFSPRCDVCDSAVDWSDSDVFASPLYNWFLLVCCACINDDQLMTEIEADCWEVF